MTSKVRTALCGLTRGNPRLEHTRARRAALDAGVASLDLIQPGTPYLDVERNKLVRLFLTGFDDEKERQFPDEYLCDFMLMLDDDIEFTPDDVTAVVDLALKVHLDTGIMPVVSGCYRSTYHDQHITVAYTLADIDPADGKRQLVPVTMEETVASKDPMVIDCAGAGFLLAHRSTLEEMQENYQDRYPQEFFSESHWPEEAHIQPGERSRWFGEDLIFCLRAQALGHPIILHRGVRLKHYKTLALTYE